MKTYNKDEFIRLRDSRFYDSFYIERTSKYRELKKFRKIFNKDFLRRMNLEDYVVGLGSIDSFCYHLERTFGCFGAISTSSAFKFGIFYSRERKQYEYYPKWGDSTEEAFLNVKESILNLLYCAENDDVSGIVNNMLAPMVKGKILHLYFPEKYFSIYANNHLDFYLKFYGLDTPSLLDGDAYYKQARLLQFKNSDPVMRDWTIDKFATFLYHAYPKAPNRQNEDPNTEHRSSKATNILASKRQIMVEMTPEVESELEKLKKGCIIKHKKFGAGKIVDINKAENLIFVKFATEEKKFMFPDAFLMGFLEIN